MPILHTRTNPGQFDSSECHMVLCMCMCVCGNKPSPSGWRSTGLLSEKCEAVCYKHFLPYSQVQPPPAPFSCWFPPPVQCSPSPPSGHTVGMWHTLSKNRTVWNQEQRHIQGYQGEQCTYVLVCERTHKNITSGVVCALQVCL